MKKIIIAILITIISISWVSVAQDVTFEVIPEAEQSSSNIWATVKSVGEWWKVWDNYKDKAYWVETTWDYRSRPWWDLSLWDQFASGIMTWDTILDYAVYLVKFIGQLALLAWAIMIIYLGYKEATKHIKFEGKLGNVVKWILVISFAYVIVKIIWSMFIS